MKILINVFSKLTPPRTNNEPNYGIAPPGHFLRYYGDDKIKTQCDINNLNVSISVKCRPPHFHEIQSRSIEK